MERRQKKPVTPKSAPRITDDRALYVISIAAELAGVHPQTLRGYERKGLLQPKRTEGRARRYSARDIEHVRLIQTLTQEHGVNLAGVEMVMQLTREVEAMQERLERLKQERLERLQAEAARMRLDLPNGLNSS